MTCNSDKSLKIPVNNVKCVWQCRPNTCDHLPKLWSWDRGPNTRFFVCVRKICIHFGHPKLRTIYNQHVNWCTCSTTHPWYHFHDTVNVIGDTYRWGGLRVLWPFGCFAKNVFSPYFVTHHHQPFGINTPIGVCFVVQKTADILIPGVNITDECKWYEFEVKKKRENSHTTTIPKITTTFLECVFFVYFKIQFDHLQ